VAVNAGVYNVLDKLEFSEFEAEASEMRSRRVRWTVRHHSAPPPRGQFVWSLAGLTLDRTTSQCSTTSRTVRLITRWTHAGPYDITVLHHLEDSSSDHSLDSRWTARLYDITVLHHLEDSSSDHSLDTRWTVRHPSAHHLEDSSSDNSTPLTFFYRRTFAPARLTQHV